jgi:uncharacterized protein YecE (DUF72 family)
VKAAYVGTSGWNYKHWRGLIYEPGFAQRRWLERIAERFDSVEVNTSFYRIPAQESVIRWQAATPPGFVFALKLWRGITHYRKLGEAARLTERFLESAEALIPERRAPLLIQLPPVLTKDVPRLIDYIAEYRALAPGSWEIAVEFRHSSWIDDETRRALDGAGAAVCLHDMAGRGDTHQPNDVPFVYVRRHGASARYSGNYAPEQIDADAADAVRWIGEGRRVYVYYNNDIGGHAFFNAIDLRAAISSKLS